MYDIIIIGGGPAGLTAATYGCRAGKSVLIIEKNAFGGQITWSPKVENFPGFLSISGTELGDKLLEQAMEQGAEVELEEAASLSQEGEGKIVRCLSGAAFQGKTIIIATGARPKPLGLPGEEELVGSGVCFCAVCDGAFYKDQDVAVAGGGNSALQDALLLSEKCRRVTLIHRRDHFRGEARLVEALKQRGNVDFLLDTRITALLGEEQLRGIVVEQNGVSRELPVSGLFVAVGHEPDLAAFRDFVELDSRGYALSGEQCLTRTPGVFVAGDCRSKAVRQLTTAVADGTAAALAACAFLDEN